MIKRLFCYCTFIFLISCHAKMTKNFDLEGHRGSRGLMPENTIPAMLEALTLGVNTLEMDAVITQDGKVVLSHEPFFNHVITTLPNGDSLPESEEKDHNIFRMNYDSVQQYDVGLKEHPGFPGQKKIAVHKPLLSAVIDSVETYVRENQLPKVMYNIEIKSSRNTDHIFHPGPAAYADILLKVISDKNISDRVVIQSFDPRPLKYISEAYPKQKISLLIEGQQVPVDSLEEKYGFVPGIVSPDYKLLSGDDVKKLHAQKISVVPWTVNDLPAARHLFEMGVDGIITDYPDRINLRTIKGETD